MRRDPTGTHQKVSEGSLRDKKETLREAISGRNDVSENDIKAILALMDNINTECGFSWSTSAAIKIPTLISKLNKPIADNLQLYELALLTPFDINYFIVQHKRLEAAGIYIRDAFDLYDLILTEYPEVTHQPAHDATAPTDSDNSNDYLKVFYDLGFRYSPETHKAYETFIKKYSWFEKKLLYPSFEPLKKLGPCTEANKPIYIAMISNRLTLPEKEQLEKYGIDIAKKEHQPLLREICVILNSTENVNCEIALTQIAVNLHQKNKHGQLTKTEQAVYEFYKEPSIESKLQSIQEKLSPLLKEAEQRDMVVYGPLQLTKHTQALRNFVIDTVNGDLTIIEPENPLNPHPFHIKTRAGMDEAIYLSRIAALTHFPHLRLDDAILKNMGDYILEKHQPIVSRNKANLENTTSKGVGAVKELPDACKYAVAIYTSELYHGVNTLLRGLPFRVRADGAHCHDIKFNLYIGILVNIAINRVTEMIHSSTFMAAEKEVIEKLRESGIFVVEHEEAYKKILLKAEQDRIITQEEKELIFDHYDALEQLFNPPNTIFSRKDSSDKFPGHDKEHSRDKGLLSMSKGLMGSPYIEGSKVTFYQPPQTRLSSDCLSTVVLSKREYEYIASSNTLSKHTGNVRLFSLYEPTSVPATAEQPYVAEALKVAYQEYLSKPYTQADHSVKCNGVTVNRPNHALAPATRGVFLLKRVIEFCADLDDGPNQKISDFCLLLLKDENWGLLVALQIGMAFRFFGRESEVGFFENQSDYTEFKKNSSHAFKKHFTEILGNDILTPDTYPASLDEHFDLCQVIGDVILHMGNPEYLDLIEHHSEVTASFAKNIWLLMSLSHDLDLFRCYTKDEYQSMLETHSEAIRTDPLLKYASDLLKATGNKMLCEFKDGEIQSCDRDYAPPFEKISTSPETAIAACEGIKYQASKRAEEERAACTARAIALLSR